MERDRIFQILAACLCLLTMAACKPGTSTVPALTDTPVPATATVEEIMETATATPRPTATARPTATPAPSPRPTATPVPTSRPLAEGECIAWYEAPSFVDREVCIEGRVNFVRSANPARTLFFVVLDPSVPDIDHCCGLIYGWLYANKLYDSTPAGGFSGLLEDKCVRLHGAIEKAEGQQHLVRIKTQEQLEIIECSECQIPDACEPAPES